MELWKEISEYEGLYSVSSLGRVKSIQREVLYSNGRTHIVKEKILKQEISKTTKMKRVTLSKQCSVERFLVHRLVGKEFIPNPENKSQINHIDGDRLNNTITNLEWCTGSENMMHAYKTNLQTALKEQKCPSAKLEWCDIHEIRDSFKSGITVKTLKTKFNVSEENIRHILRNSTWKDNNYNPILMRKINDLKYIPITKAVNIMNASGMNMSEIAKVLKVKHAAIYSILKSPIYQEWYKRNCVNSGEA